MDKKKNDFFENATKCLLYQLDNMDLSPMERMQAKNLVLLFRDSFKITYVKKATFASRLADGAESVFTYDADAFCRASSCAFIKQMQSKKWRLMYINELWSYGPHCFIQHVPTKTVFDLTADQYTIHGIKVPYDIGYAVKIDADDEHDAEIFLNAVFQANDICCTKGLN
ncbi:MAG: hypothetical protein MJ187_01520 [Alphaproteobacteria bacterium]|nr:hypothetical protein [Alphaproteobacteria bacterium]